MGRKSKADVRKQEILQYFYEVMCDEGFENASIAKIAERMSVNPSLLIHYFKTKEEMVVDLVDFLLNRYEDTFLGHIQQLQNTQARFEKIIGTLFSTDWLTVGNYSVFYACYYLAARHDRIKERFNAMYTEFRQILVQEATQWIADGVIKLQDPVQVAEYLIMLTEGMAFYQRVFTPAEYAARAAFTRDLAIRTLTH